MTGLPWMARSYWIAYPVALVIGVVAGLLAHSGVVAGAAALVVAVAWVGIGRSR